MFPIEAMLSERISPFPRLIILTADRERKRRRGTQSRGQGSCHRPGLLSGIVPPGTGKSPCGRRRSTSWCESHAVSQAACHTCSKQGKLRIIHTNLMFARMCLCMPQTFYLVFLIYMYTLRQKKTTHCLCC